MITSNFPVSEAKPLIAIPKDISQIGFFGGENAKEIDASIKRDYKDFSVMQIGNYSNGKIRGSNPFYVVGVQSKLPFGVRVATQSDLETAMRINALNLSGTYEDTGLVLMGVGNPNLYLSINLMNQVKKRLGKNTKMPVMIPLYGIELVKDKYSPHGLAFKLKDNAEINYAPILKKPNSNFNYEDINIKTGLPTKLRKGNRILWTRDSGLSRLLLNENLNIVSNDGDLANSISSGILVLTLIG